MSWIPLCRGFTHGEVSFGVSRIGSEHAPVAGRDSGDLSEVGGRGLASTPKSGQIINPGDGLKETGKVVQAGGVARMARTSNPRRSSAATASSRLTPTRAWWPSPRNVRLPERAGVWKSASSPGTCDSRCVRPTRKRAALAKGGVARHSLTASADRCTRRTWFDPQGTTQSNLLGQYGRARGCSQELMDNFFRHEYGRLVAVLTRIVGTASRSGRRRRAIALLQALQSWSLRGIPEEPAGWLFRVSKNCSRCAQASPDVGSATAGDRRSDRRPGIGAR